jgi:geranylgeranylglycerol-phosphate geranylgeranyltransferase
MTGMAFVYGAVVVGNFVKALVPAIFAFLANVAREVIKDIEDVEGDKKEGAVTLPVRYGERPALWITTATIVLLILATLAAFQLGFYTVVYLSIVLVVDALLAIVMAWMWIDLTPPNMNRMSNILKICMVIGLLAIFFGSHP